MTLFFGGEGILWDWCASYAGVRVCVCVCVARSCRRMDGVRSTTSIVRMNGLSVLVEINKISKGKMEGVYQVGALLCAAVGLGLGLLVLAVGFVQLLLDRA